MIRDSHFGYNAALPENIREIFLWLCQDVASLRSKWNLYLGLFSQEENTKLLSELAQASFQMIEESLRDDLTIAICRLSDPPQSLRNDNLSLRTLIERLHEPGNVTELLKDFLEACAPVREIRNKRIAHNDLNTKLHPRVTPFAGVGRKEMARIVQLAEQILNWVIQRYVDVEYRFEILSPGGADDLIFWLKAGLEAEKENKARRLEAYLGNAPENK